MSCKVFLFVVLAVTASKAQDNNQLCPCDTEQDTKANLDLWELLQKLSVDVSNDQKDLFSVYPGSLHQFDCSHCDEKQRKKREPTENPEAPEEPEVPVKKATAEAFTEENLSAEDGREKRYINFHDFRCPKGRVRVAHYCIDQTDVDDVSDIEDV